MSGRLGVLSVVGCLLTFALTLPAPATSLLVTSGGTEAVVLRYDRLTGAPLGADAAIGLPAGRVENLPLPATLTFGPGAVPHAFSELPAGVLRFDRDLAPGGPAGSAWPLFAATGVSDPEDRRACMTFGPDGDLYLALTAAGSIVRFDGDTGAFLGTFVPAGSGGLATPTRLRFGPDGNLYVCGNNGQAVRRYHGQTGAFIDTFVVPRSAGLNDPRALAAGMAFGPDGCLYVVNNDQILRYNGATGAFMGAFVATGSGDLVAAGGLAFGPDGHLYVSSSGTGNVLRYDGSTGAFLDVIVSPGSGGLGQPLSLTFALEAPADLTATAVSAARIHLAWTDGSDDETGFEIERRTGSGPFLLIGVVGANITQFSDAGRAPETSYTYRIRAVGPTGPSGYCRPVSRTTPAAPPAAPTNLAAIRILSHQVELTWTDHSTNETAFAIFRKTGGGDFVRVGVAPANATRYTDRSVGPGTSYTFRVRAANDTSVSGWTGEITLTTPQARPAAPTGLAAGVVAARRVELTWADNSSNETAFAIFRRTGGGSFVRVGVVPPNSTRFRDLAASPGTTYTYRVRAAHDTDVSGWSNEVTLTTPQERPAAPADLTVTGVTAARIDLGWTDNSNNETAFAIFRKTGSGDYVRVGVVPVNVTHFSDPSVSPHTAYTYRVRAAHDTDVSAWSGEVPAATP